MKHCVLTKARLAAMAAMACAGLSFAQENPLGAMATGETRAAQTLAQAQAPADTEAAAPAEIAAPAPAEQPAASGDAWLIEHIVIVDDDSSFAEKPIFKSAPRSVAGRLQNSFMRGEAVPESDVRAAVAQIQADLQNAKYYLARIDSNITYDAASKTLTIIVDPGYLGDVRVRFSNPGQPFDKPVTDYSAATFEEYPEEGRWFSQRQIERKLGMLAKDDSGARYGEDGDALVFSYASLQSVISEINAHPDLKLDTFINVASKNIGGAETRVANLDFVARERDVPISQPAQAGRRAHPQPGHVARRETLLHRVQLHDSQHALARRLHHGLRRLLLARRQGHRAARQH